MSYFGKNLLVATILKLFWLLRRAINLEKKGKTKVSFAYENLININNFLHWLNIIKK